jgi:anti-anti-sigma factor
VVRLAAPLKRGCASFHRTPTNGPSSWKVTEVADLRGDRLLVLHGELDIATAPELVGMLHRLRRQGHAVELDLAEVTFMDSTGLSTLMDAHLAAQGNGWSFSVRRSSPAVRRVFELAGVTRLLDE